GWTGVAAVSADGKRFAAVGEKYTVLIQDTVTGEVKLRMRGHKGAITHLAFSPDGLRLISVGRDRTGYLWDAAAGERLAVLDGHRGSIRAAVFSPDGKLFATGGTDKRILLYDVPPPGTKPGEVREKAACDAHSVAVSCIAFSPDSRLLASGSDALAKAGPAEVKLWDVEKLAPLAAWSDHTAAVAALAFHPTRPILVSAGSDPGFRVWNLDAKKPIAFRRTQTALKAVAFTADGAELLTGSLGQAMLAWDVNEWQERARFVGHSGAITGLFGTSRSLIFSTSMDRSLRAWSLARAASGGSRMA